MDIEVNYLAILISGLIYMILGFLWFSPLMFAKPWMRLMKFEPGMIDNSNVGMIRTYSLSFIASLVTAYVLELLLSSLGINSAIGGISVAILLGIGFVAMPTFTDYLYGSKPLKLYLIENGYRFAYLIIMGALLAIW